MSKNQRAPFVTCHVCFLCNKLTIWLETSTFHGNFGYMCKEKILYHPSLPGVACENNAVCRNKDFFPPPPPPPYDLGLISPKSSLNLRLIWA